MLAGHTMLALFGTFVVGLGAWGAIVAGAAPLIFIIALVGLEVGIAFLQAYVFTILSCIYLNDAVNLHH